MHGAALELRSVDADEGLALADLRVLAMRESLEAVGRFNADRARARFLDGFDPALTRAIVVAGQTAGFMVLRPLADHLLLDHLYIAPSHQAQGLGAAVLRQVFAEADAANQALRVGALKGSRSNAFYLRHGFRLVESAEWDHFYVRLPSPASSSPSSPRPAHACPLCGQANGCAAARTGSFDTPCWCTEVRFNPALLARVPASQQGKACICRACAEGSPA